MKYFLSFLTLLSLAFGSWAQAPYPIWRMNFDGSVNESIYASAIAPNGDVVVSGWFSGTVDFDPSEATFNLTSVGAADVFIARYTKAGLLLWAKKIGGSGDDDSRALTIDNAGNIHVVGKFNFTADLDPDPNFTLNRTATTTTNNDVFIIKLNSSGILQSAYTMGNNLSEAITDIKSDALGNIYLSGIFSASLDVDVTATTFGILSAGGSDGFIAKYNSSYALQWAKIIGGTGNDEASTLDVDADGNVYVAGNFNATAQFVTSTSTLTATGLQDGFIMKLSGLGNLIWTKKIGGSEYDYINSIKLDKKGGIAAIGTFVGNANLNPNGASQFFSTNSTSTTHTFVSKLDTNQATAIWIKQIEAQVGSSIDCDTAGNVYASGGFNGTKSFPVTGGVTLTAVGGYDVWVSKISGTGAFNWVKSYAPPISASASIGRKVMVDASGNDVYIALGDQAAELIRISNCDRPYTITGNTRLCALTTTSYTVNTVNTAASYTWVLPSGWNGTSTTNTINITPAANSGMLKVVANTTCGVSDTASLAISYGTNSIDANLTHYWAATTTDNDKDLLSNNLLTITNAIKDTDRFGNLNNAYRLTSTSSVLTTGANLPTGPSTIALWYYYQKNGTSNNVILGSNSTTLPAGHPLLLTDNNTEKLYPWSNTGAAIGSGVTIVPNTWYHITLARNASSFQLYLNGELVATGTNLATTNFDRIGNNRPGFAQGATGKFDDIRIYSSFLNAETIKSIYEVGSVKSINLGAATCINKMSTFSIEYSNANAGIQWKKNASNTGNSANYNTVINAVDTSVSVQINDGCKLQSFTTKFTPSTSDSVSATVSANCSFVLGVDTFVKSGIYTRTLTNAKGCDSVVTLTLTISNATATNLSANLINYWTLQAADSLRDIVSKNLITAPSSAVVVADRFNNAASALNLTANAFTFLNTLPTTNYSLAFWFKADSTSAEIVKTIIGSINSIGRSRYLFMYDGQLFTTNSAGATQAASGVTITNNQWNHIAFTFDNTATCRVYFNGNLVATRSSMFAGGVAYLGNFITMSECAYGSFDDVKFYNQVLQASDLSKLAKMPSVLRLTRPTSNCQGAAVSSTIHVTASNQNVIEGYKNNTLVSSDTVVTINNALPSDSSISFTIYNNCAYETYTSKFNVTPSIINIYDTTCANYTYNGKTYTTTGVYRDTIYSNVNCTTVVNLNLVINTQNAVSLNSGLVKFWALNSGDNRRDLALEQNNAYTLTGGSYGTSRAGVANTAYNITATTQLMSLASALQGSNVSVSFWYQYNYVGGSYYNGARTLLANSQANGNLAKYLYVNNMSQLYCGTNGSNAGVSANTTFISGTWYHIVYQLSTTGVAKVFVNGVEKVSINAVPVYPITLIGNRADGNEPGVGVYDDVKFYNRLITPVEANALSKEGTMLAMPSVSQACVGSSVRIAFNLTKDSTTSIELYKGNTLLANDTAVTINSIALADTVFSLRVIRNCFVQTFVHKLTVAQTSVAPTLIYNSTTKRITATSTFNKYVLYRNNNAIDSNTTSGNINYLASQCGSYQAKFYTTGINCPSTSNLVVVLKDTNRVSTSICQGKGLLFNGNTITNAGVYFATFSGTQNCDSLIQLTVSIKQTSSSTLNRTGCGSIIINGKTYTQSGQYKDTLVNAVGCDSVITLNLTINTGGPSVRTFNINSCNQYVLNNKTYTQTGSYRDTLFGASSTGCDSILVLNLTLNKNSSTQTITACKSYLFDGKILTQSGAYYDTITNVAGCDSIVTLNLTVNTVNNGVTRNGNTLTANETGATYQWINCATNQPISGALAKSFTPAVSGNYKVVVSKNSCVDTSVCQAVTIITCNTKLSYTVLSPDSVACKDVSVLASNATLPITLNISWNTNPNGNTSVLTDSVKTYVDVCPGTYKVKVTDANGCTDSVEFTISDAVGLHDVLTQPTFTVYPNPANDLVQVNFTKVSLATISIMDMQGRVWKKVNTNELTPQIDIISLNAGLYLIKVEQAEGISVSRLIKK